MYQPPGQRQNGHQITFVPNSTNFLAWSLQRLWNDEFSLQIPTTSLHTHCRFEKRSYPDFHGSIISFHPHAWTPQCSSEIWRRRNNHKSHTLIVALDNGSVTAIMKLPSSISMDSNLLDVKVSGRVCSRPGKNSYSIKSFSKFQLRR